MALPSRSFAGSTGSASTNLGSAEQLIIDLDNLFAMFDPNAELSNGSPGGIPDTSLSLLTPDPDVTDVGFAGNGNTLLLLSHIVKILKEITGETNWYSAPDSNIHDLAIANVLTMISGSVIYRKSAGTGAPEVQSLAILKEDLGIESNTETTIGELIAGATAKATPIDADIVGFVDTQASNIIKKATWANIKAFLKTYFDTIYGTPTVGDGTITLAKMANMATASLIYRKTAGAGVPEVNSLSTLKSDLGDMPASAINDQNDGTGVSGGYVKIYTCTQAEYDAIGTPDVSTLYFIKA